MVQILGHCWKLSFVVYVFVRHLDKTAGARVGFKLQADASLGGAHKEKKKPRCNPQYFKLIL